MATMAASDHTVLLLDPQKASRARGVAALTSLGCQVLEAADVFEAHALIDEANTVVASHPAAAELYPRLRSMGRAFVAAFATRLPHKPRVAEELGADAFVSRPYQAEALGPALYAAGHAQGLRARALAAEAALASARGVRVAANGAGGLQIDLFKTLLPLEIRRARRHGYPIAICVVSFDPVPQAQRLPLLSLAEACEPVLRRAIRDVDLAVRYGEGRFLVFLPHTDGKGAETVGRRIVGELRRCRVQIGGKACSITGSVGIATPRAGKPSSFSTLIRHAHAALKAAQLKGGDQAILRS